MTLKDVAQLYIEFLEKGDALAIVSLFAQDGVVHSPLYGIQPASSFYRELFEDSSQSELKVLGVFEDSDTPQLALYFNYRWTLANKSFVEFEVVDILEFNEENKITCLKIIYDTVHSRKAFDEMKE